MKHSRNKQSIGFTLLPTWSRVVESHTVPHRLTLTHPGHESSLCSAWPARESLHSQLGYQTDCCLIVLSVLQSPLFYLIMAPKLKSSDASNSDMLNRSCRVLRLSKDSPLNKERKKNICWEWLSSPWKGEEEKEIGANCAEALHPAKVAAAVHDMCLATLEKALQFYDKIFCDR